MKTIFKIFAFTLISTLVFAQKSWQVSGKVLDMSKSPMPFANVFVNNTRIGATTDENGEFLLNIPSRIQKIELVISFVGFTTMKNILTVNDPKLQNLTFIFKSGIELKEIAVIGKRDKEWKKKWRIFERSLMGESDLRKSCKILNPEVIRLEYDKDKNVVATADEPIIIRNNALGLIISYQIDFFETNGEKTFYAGSKFFKNIDSNEVLIQKKWEKARNDAYENTFRNFLVSLSQRKLKEHGFEVFKVLIPKTMYFGKTNIEDEITNGSLAVCNEDDICSYNTRTGQFRLYSDKQLMVFAKNTRAIHRVFIDYPYKYSIIEMPKLQAVFTENGWLTKPNGISLRGFWGDEGFADMLPEDYFIEEDSIKNDIIVKNEIVAIIPKTFKSDTIINDTVIQGVIYDKGAIAQEEKKGFAIVSNDINVKISENDANLSIFDLLRRIPGMVVTNVQGSYQIHFRATNTNIDGKKGGSITPALVLDGTFMDDEETVMSILNSINVRDIKDLGAVKYGNSAAFGSRGSNGTIVINTKK